nr:MAG TPA: hypothetical protein [Caudoviricetes sp.]
MKIFKAETTMNFNILNGNNNKLNTIRINLVLNGFRFMLSFSAVRFSVLFDSVAEHRGGYNSFEFIIFNFEVEIVHTKFLSSLCLLLVLKS